MYPCFVLIKCEKACASDYKMNECQTVALLKADPITNPMVHLHFIIKFRFMQHRIYLHIYIFFHIYFFFGSLHIDFWKCKSRLKFQTLIITCWAAHLACATGLSIFKFIALPGLWCTRAQQNCNKYAHSRDMLILLLWMRSNLFSFIKLWVQKRRVIIYEEVAHCQFIHIYWVWIKRTDLLELICAFFWVWADSHI